MDDAPGWGSPAYLDGWLTALIVQVEQNGQITVTEADLGDLRALRAALEVGVEPAR